jgi:hypothetical protein
MRTAVGMGWQGPLSPRGLVGAAVRLRLEQPLGLAPIDQPQVNQLRRSVECRALITPVQIRFSQSTAFGVCLPHLLGEEDEADLLRRVARQGLLLPLRLLELCTVLAPLLRARRQEG